MSYCIFLDQYEPLLRSDDEETVKNVLQVIFELLANGKGIARSKKSLFISMLTKQVKSKSQKVRKWAYHCACFYQDELICKAIKNNLENEQNKENIIWALTALSVVYDDIDKLKQCVGRRHDEFVEIISKNYLTDALFLFGGLVNINPKTILSTNNSTDLIALTKIYGYKNLVENKYPSVTESVVRELEKNDDPNVREYSYWAQELGGTEGHFLNMADDSDIGARKWQISLQVQEGDEDFIVSTLKPLSMCPQKINIEIKNGVLRGLKKISYISKCVPYIHCWFEKETENSIVFQLLKYIITNCCFNYEDGTYFDDVEDSLSDASLAPYIIGEIKNNPQFNLRIEKNGENYMLKLNKKGESGVTNYNIIGSNNVAIANNQSTAINATPDIKLNEFQQLIQEVRNQANSGLSQDDKQTVEESVSFIEQEIALDKPRKKLIHNILGTLNAIKGTAEFAAAVTALISFFQ